MIPLSDEHESLRTPVMNYAIIGTTLATWFLVQGAGFEQRALAFSVCDLGLVPGEITGMARIGTAVPLGGEWACVVDNAKINVLTPITSMFLHGSWSHLLGNLLFLWVFGNNIEDSMGRLRFLVFYLLCGVAAGLSHTLLNADSPIPTVGASGAISGVLGAYLVLYPRVHVRMLFIFIVFFKVFRIRAWLVLVWWFLWQVLSALPELTTMRGQVSSGVAFGAHIGGFVTGLLLVKLFENRELVARRAVPA